MNLKSKILEQLKKNPDELYSFEDLLNLLSCEEKELQDVLNTLEMDGIIYLTKRKQKYCLGLRKRQYLFIEKS